MFDIPELEECEWIVIKDEGLEMDESSHLWWQRLEPITTQIQVNQVTQIHEDIPWDPINAVIAQIQYQQSLGLL